MTQPYNALYGSPQAPQDNALYYDDTQGMPRQRPADPLRWLANAIGQNKDLPAPQFFMDPRALSARNMLHSALNTSANWLDGTKDPSLIGPEEMVSPLGLAPMGSIGRAATAAAKSAPKTWYHGTNKDFDAFNTPEVYFSSLKDEAGGYGSKVIPAHVKSDNPLRYDGGELWKGSPPQAVIDDLIKEARAKGNDSVVVKVPGFSGEFHQAPAREHMIAIQPGTVTSATSGARLFADNAKGSAPGTVINSLGELPPVSGDLGFGGRVGDATARFKAASQRERELASTIPQDVVSMGYRYRFNPDEMIRAASDDWASSSEKALRPLIEKHRGDIEAWARAKREMDRLAYESDSENFLKTISESGRNPRAPDEPMAVYHGTDAKFDKYSGDIARSQSDAAKDIGIDAMFVTPRKEFAAGYGTPMPLDLRGGHYFDVTSTDDLARIAPYINSRPDAQQMWKKIEKRILDGGQTWGLLEGRDMAAAIKGAGYDGVRMTENYHTPSGGQALARTMAVFSKGKVTKRGTDDVVFSSPSASAPGLAANSTQQDDQGVMSILRRYGLAD